jgi:hypothetical protein
MLVLLNAMQMLKLVLQLQLLENVMMDTLELLIQHVLNVHQMQKLVQQQMQLQLVMMDSLKQLTLLHVVHVQLELKLVLLLELIQLIKHQHVWMVSTYLQLIVTHVEEMLNLVHL